MFKFNCKYIEEKCLRKMQPYDIKAVLGALQFLLEHTWADIVVKKIKKYHTVPIRSCKDYIANYHLKCQSDETQETTKDLISFAYKDKGRLLGFQNNKIFYITYIDVDHSYC